ncbi:MAG TPA: heterodisulfide reductase-related iron-sulfur binding cluster [Kofleriaceae bacterium]|nr:heterodisulfide reductase-related iron-sulfur binding cluster [Kofleriaceae bacterium]
MKQVLFILLLAASVAFFARTVWRFVRALAAGTADPRPRLDELPHRLLDVLVYFFGQVKVAEEGPQHRTSKHHLIIFWGFLIITIATADIVISGVWPAVSLALLPAVIYKPLYTTVDVMNLLVLAMILWAVFRRLVVRPRLIPWNLDAGLILGAIGALMLTHFLFHGYQAAAAISAGGEAPGYLPISGLVGRALAPLSAEAAERGELISYWLHVLIVLTFLNYLPYSKHIHLLGALPNILTRNRSERLLDLPKLDLEDENQWGVGRFEQLSWKSLLDTYACTECARCTNYCPAYNTGKNLSPMQLIHDIRYEMLDRTALRDRIAGLEDEIAGLTEYSAAHGFNDAHPHPDLVHARERLAAAQAEREAMPRLTGGRVQEDTLWACTTCGACQEVCPVFIEHPVKIIQMRQNLVLEQEKTPGELQRTFRNLERQSNPWGRAADERMDWASGLDVPTIEDHPDPEYILWVGCAGAFDARIVKQTQAMVKILHAAGVDYAVLGHQEACTGDPARRAGNEMLFQALAEQNVETLKSVHAKKIVTSCPHCLHTLRHDYPQFGGEFEVVHHTQLIDHLYKTGKLTSEKAPVRTLTYHDSCYLGRWNREFDAPRNIVRTVLAAGSTGAAGSHGHDHGDNHGHNDGYHEMKRSKRHGMCCGAGGARMFMEETVGERVNINRTDEVIAANVEAVAVACPFCNVMLTDGMKHRNVEDKIQVLDVAELVAASIPDVPVDRLVRKKSSS